MDTSNTSTGKQHTLSPNCDGSAVHDSPHRSLCVVCCVLCVGCSGSGSQILDTDVKEKLRCIKTDGTSIMTGGDAGVIRLHSLKNLALTPVASIPTDCGAISCLALTENGMRMLSTFTFRVRCRLPLCHSTHSCRNAMRVF